MSELRKRGTKEESKSESKKQDGAPRAASKPAAASIKATAETALVALLKAFQQASALFDAHYPTMVKYATKAAAMYETLAPLHLECLVPTLLGIVLCFFGGHFVLLIAAAEAYRVTGWETTRACALELYKDLYAVKEASKKDDGEDADADGVADVSKLPPNELLGRKFSLFMKSVDPNRVTESLSGIYAGFVAVLATLKLDFCKAITLGASISDAVLPPLLLYLVPLLCSLSAVPPEHHKWVPLVVTYLVKYVIISLAFFLQRVVSAIHSSIRGGLMIARNLLAYLEVMNIYKLDEKDTYLDEILGYALAFMGFYFQLSHMFKLPFPLSLFLFPACVFESLLAWFVAA